MKKKKSLGTSKTKKFEREIKELKDDLEEALKMLESSEKKRKTLQTKLTKAGKEKAILLKKSNVQEDNLNHLTEMFNNRSRAFQTATGKIIELIQERIKLRKITEEICDFVNGYGNDSTVLDDLWESVDQKCKVLLVQVEQW
ncbi:MAG: hypothetical protein KAQ63_01915 [Candidatus Moranbacteria bacterium]|nr:hypothetical protein [Candidatus Moranbacteria bacterium]